MPQDEKTEQANPTQRQPIQASGEQEPQKPASQSEGQTFSDQSASSETVMDNDDLAAIVTEEKTWHSFVKLATKRAKLV
ncbi:hypothetical protein [Enterococcus casseliflavus]|uniref:hypothetical protein n=1 Tax=Enterococcus casseliflavus TaxID=37734 RepID=UPI003DA5325D